MANATRKKKEKNQAGFLKDMRSALEIKHFTQQAKETYSDRMPDAEAETWQNKIARCFNILD